MTVHFFPTNRGTSRWRLAFCLMSLWMGVTILPAQAAGAQKLTVAMSLTPLSAPVIIAKHNGYFRDNDLDVATRDYIGGNRTIQAVFQGKADIATSSEAVVMFNSFKRSDFAVLCTFVTSDNDVKIIARADSGVRTVGDLVGRRVGTVSGASAQFFLDETLLLAGIDSAKVKMVHVNPEDLQAALARGDVDVSVVWEPLAYLTKKKMGAAAVQIPHDKFYTETFNAVMLKEFAVKNPDASAKFVRALIQATEFIQKHPNESQRIVATRLKKSLELIKAVWVDFKFGVSLHQWLLTTLENEARWAIGRGLVSASEIPNYMKFLHIGPLSRVRPDAVTIFR
jgi:sulfonate transport system substrate-binding protein